MLVFDSMKKFIIKVFIFFTLVVLVDYLFGVVCSFMIKESKGGVTKQMHNLCFEDQYDILIMGSSRAHHHYVPEIIADSLGATVYNAGQDGNGIILHYGVLQMVCKRYNPKMIIYDVYKPFDIYKYAEDQNNTRYIQPLKKYHNENGIKAIMTDINKRLELYLNSNLYRLNESFVSIMCDYLLTRKMDVNGYLPLYGEYKIVNKKTKDNKPKELELDSIKLNYIEKLISFCKYKNIQLVFSISPSYEQNDIESYLPIIDICKKHDIALMNLDNAKPLNEQSNLWKDPVHLNHNGAIEFTNNYVIPELKKHYIKQ